jgi:hypothetical protein
MGVFYLWIYLRRDLEQENGAAQTVSARIESALQQS